MDPTVPQPGARAAFIRPVTLLSQVKNTAPFLVWGQAPTGRLIEAGGHEMGHLEVLAGGAALEESAAVGEEWNEDYFALCLACHHATVATFVPTDVDTKIRGLLWRCARSVDSMERMFRMALRAHQWSIRGISARATELAGVGPVSGHDGEMLSVYAGALGTFLRAGADALAREAEEAIVNELEREAAEFRFAYRTQGCELDTLRLATSLTHNAGDLDQGISFWQKSEAHKAAKARLGRLAHENKAPFDGWFQVAAGVYRRAMAAEGHRHYPLRGAKALRRSADYLLPLGPFFDDWGAVIATHPGLTMDERAEVVGALITGCRKIEGQRGYYRALHGFFGALRGSAESVIRKLPATARNDWKNAELRRQVAVQRVSFESMMRKMIRTPGP